MKGCCLKLPMILLMGTLLFGWQANAVASELTPDQEEITTVLKHWTRAWGNGSLTKIRKVYDQSGKEWSEVKSNIRGVRHVTLSVAVKDIFVFGNEAIARMKIRGDWRVEFLAFMIKQEGEWKLQFRTLVGS